MLLLTSLSVWMVRNQGLMEMWWLFSSLARYPKEIFVGGWAEPLGDFLHVFRTDFGRGRTFRPTPWFGCSTQGWLPSSSRRPASCSGSAGGSSTMRCDPIAVRVVREFGDWIVYA